MSDIIKLSSLATREFWEIRVLFEDEHLLALNKPPRLLTSPDRYDPDRPNLRKLLHTAISEGRTWAKTRGLTYLMNAHRLDFETSGVILLAKTKPILIALANLFGEEKPVKIYVALAHGAPETDAFEVDAKIAPHPAQPGLMYVDPKRGKRARTLFAIRQRFTGYTLLQCRSLTGRPHQNRVHLRHAGLPIVGDSTYGGRALLLSGLKPKYRLKPGQTERPLIGTTALHAEQLSLTHPTTGETITISAPWPKDLAVAVKYLQRYAPSSS